MMPRENGGGVEMSEKTVKYSKALKAIKAAEIMKKYCTSYDHCRDCIFDNGISCEVGNHSSPYFWDLQKVRDRMPEP